MSAANSDNDAGGEDSGGGGGTRRVNLAGQARSEGASLQKEAAKKKLFFSAENEFGGEKKGFR